jgi:hypothetical protein
MRLDRGQIEVMDDLMAGVIREKTPAERLRIGFGLWVSAQQMLLSHLATQHPDWDAARVSREVARRLSHGAV